LIKSIEQEKNIIIQSAESPDGEFKIKSPNNGYYKADGYHKETNTIYEYNGDFFHGNPRVFDPNDTNKLLKKTYGELYQNTIKKENYLISLGYNLIVQWETPIL
jgi:hypothetical protein